VNLLDVVRQVRRHLEENGRVSYRLLRRQFELGDDALDELVEELVDVQQVAVREDQPLARAATAVVSIMAIDRPLRIARSRASSCATAVCWD
jgi:hypothetical protein